MAMTVHFTLKTYNEECMQDKQIPNKSKRLTAQKI